MQLRNESKYLLCVIWSKAYKYLMKIRGQDISIVSLASDLFTCSSGAINIYTKLISFTISLYFSFLWVSIAIAINIYFAFLLNIYIGAFYSILISSLFYRIAYFLGLKKSCEKSLSLMQKKSKKSIQTQKKKCNMPWS